MHSASMPDSAGTFENWLVSGTPCRKCKGTKVRYRVWESSCGGYEDLNYQCESCGHSWWVDGPDA